MIVSDDIYKRLDQYFETDVSIAVPGYLEITDQDGELLGLLEATANGWQLRVDGEFVENIL